MNYLEKIFKLFEDNRFCLDISCGKNGYRSGVYYDAKISIAICNFHSLNYLNGKVCTTKSGNLWEEGKIIIPIPVNEIQGRFLIDNIKIFREDPDRFEKLTNYFKSYGFR